MLGEKVGMSFHLLSNISHWLTDVLLLMVCMRHMWFI